MPRTISIIFIIIFALSKSAFADEPYTLEKIVVGPISGLSGVSTSTLEKTYPVDTITASEINEKNLDTLSDALDYVSGLDVRSRGAFGIQDDLSLRGSNFEQVGILIDGVKINDPQTGHHNLDIPLTVFDIERIEVVKEGDSSLCGAGAFSGSLNFITKKPAKKILQFNTLFGEYSLYGQAASFSLPQKEFFNIGTARVSFDHKISKAARPNTDFEYNTASFYFNRDFDTMSLDALLGYQKKDFGADSFYSNLFPEEEEHTETLFIKTGLDTKFDSASRKDNLYFRKHRDKFILQRNNPTFINYHTTCIYGANSQLNLPIKFGDLSLGLDAGRDEINSTNLGRHSRMHGAGFSGLYSRISEDLNSDLRLRLDNYQKWGLQESYNFGLGYDITNNLRIKSSLSHAFRIPSFTELYYSDAANKGNPDLKVEKSRNFSLGLDLKGAKFDMGVDGYLRQGRNLIDWTRTSQSGVWQATNLGRVDFYGMEFSSGIRPRLKLKPIVLEKINFSYSYITADKKASGFFSKYALDILKHQYILGIYSSCLGFNINWQLSYNKRYYGETYFVGNIYIGKKIANKDFTLEPFLGIDNFSNAKYSEISGVLQPGRWIKSGIKFLW